MTKRGEKLAGVSTAHLRQRFSTETDPKAVKRLTAALEYKSGLSPAKIGVKYGVPEQTIYGWLDRFAERGIDAALYDTPRPGRPRLLSEEQQQRFVAVVNAPPSEAGYDAPAWSPALARIYLEDAFDITYSWEHCRRLLHEAGLSVQTARPIHYEADPEEQGRWRAEFKKSGQR
jgi:transposase